MTNPAAILFDLDDTLLNDSGATHDCWAMACNTYAPRLGSVSAVELHAAIDAYRRWYWDDPDRHRQGRLDLQQARRHIVTTAVQRLGFNAPEIACQLADYHTLLRDEAMALFPQTLAVLQRTQESGIRAALITNGNAAPQRQKIDRFGLGHFFQTIVIEGEYGSGKPDPDVYRFALNQLSLEPTQAWMVGDNLEWDVAAPQRLGIYGIWNDIAGRGLPADSAVQPDRIINGIGELLTLIA
jgi:putative hydrolase of the HAD superfamily